MRIPDKKIWRVITDEIEKFPSFGIKFGRKTADITYGISAASCAALYCRKANKDRNFVDRTETRLRDVAFRSLYGWK